MHPIDQIETYLTDGLPPAERSAFEEHMAACPQCAARVDQARAADARMNTFFADAHLSADFEDRMIVALNACQPRLIRPIMIHPMVRRAAVGIAASLMLGGIGFVASQATGPKTSAMIGTLAAVLPGNEANDQVTDSAKASSHLKNIAAARVAPSKDGEAQFMVRSEHAYAFRNRDDAATPAVHDRRASMTTFNPTDGPVASGSLIETPTDGKPVSGNEQHLAITWAVPEAIASTPAKPAGGGGAVAWNDSAALGLKSDLGRANAGEASQTLSGANTYPGATTVSSAGTLQLGGQTTAGLTATVPGSIGGLQGQLPANANGGMGGNATFSGVISGGSAYSGAGGAFAAGPVATANPAAGDFALAIGDSSAEGLKQADQSEFGYFYAAGGRGQGKMGGKDQPAAVATPALQVAQADAKAGRDVVTKLSKSENLVNGLSGGLTAVPPTSYSPVPAANAGTPSVEFKEGEDRKSGAKLNEPLNAPTPVEAKIAPNTADVTTSDRAEAGVAANTGVSASDTHTKEGKKAQQNVAVAQVEEGRKRAALERDSTIHDLQKTADDLTKQGRTTEAAGVVAQIQQLDPTAKPTAINQKEVEQKQFPLLTGKLGDEKPNPAAPAVPPVQNPVPAVPPAQNPAPAPAHVDAPAIVRPKIIRTGEMEFEIESFETAAETIKKIVEEEGGYVSTTDSDKLPNGKVKGSIVLRVAPERLDTLVLKLRGIGDLRTQNIRAQDITKQYTDMESRLRAAQAMYDQIFEIIKSGKAAVKDLLEAEKQLGVWREKVEQLTGEINYYANQVALSTLTLTLFEKDIRTPAVASETETVTMTVVTEKVEDAAGKAKDAIATAKGRIIASQIEQHDAGEYLATITAQVPPDAADAVIARLRQIDGQVNHFDRQRSQTTSNGTSPVDARATDPVKVKREDVMINLTLFNLAKLTPRRQTEMTLATKSVDDAKSELEEQVRAAGGRIIDARTEYPRPDQKKGTVSFDVPSEKADALIATLKGLGESLQISTIENPNAQGVTESKRGFNVTIFDLAAVPPRRVTTLTLVTATVDKVQHDLIVQIRAAGGRVIDTKLEHPTPDKTTGTLAVDIPAEKADAFFTSLKESGETLQVANTDNTAPQNVTDSKRGFVIALRSLTTFKARESEQVQLASANVQDAFNKLRTLLHAQNGRVLTEHLDEQDAANPIGQLEFEISRDAFPTIDKEMLGDGQIVTRVDDRSTDTDNTVDSKIYVRLVINSAEQLPPRQTSELSIETADVQKAMDDLRARALTAGGRQVDNPAISQTDGGQTTATVRLNVPLDQVQPLLDAADDMGARKGRNTSIDTHAPDGKLARAMLTVKFTTPATLTAADDGIWAGVRRGLGTSLVVLSYSVMLIIIGLCVVVPLGVVIWGGWRGMKWARKNSSTSAPSGGVTGVSG